MTTTLLRHWVRLIPQFSPVKCPKGIGCYRGRTLLISSISKNTTALSTTVIQTRPVSGRGSGGGDKLPPDNENVFGKSKQLVCPNCSNPLEFMDEHLASTVSCDVCKKVYKFKELDSKSSATQSQEMFKKEEAEVKMPTPKEISAYLDRHVVGQEKAKKKLASALYEFYKLLRVNLPKKSIFDTNKTAKVSLSDLSPHELFHNSKGSNKKSKKKPGFDAHFGPTPYKKDLQLPKPNGIMPIPTKEIKPIEITPAKSVISKSKKPNIRWNKVEAHHRFVLELISPDVMNQARSDKSALGPHQKDEQEIERRGSHVLEQSKKFVKADKSNIILLGPTGSGKTLMVQKLAKIMDVPFAQQDCTGLTQAGYVGEDIEAVISKLYNDANGSIEKTQQGIVYLDEVDKIGRAKHMQHLNSRDVGGEGVQQSFLKLLEGTVVNVPVKNGSKMSATRGETVQIDTTNILFIASGAFIGIDKLIAKRTNKRNLGFGAVEKQEKEGREMGDVMMGFEKKEKTEDEEIEEIRERDRLLNEVSSKDLIEFGFIPEFVGRFTKIIHCHGLDQKDYLAILTRVENNIIEQKQKLFELDGVNLQFTDGAKVAISEKAFRGSTGARGLMQIVDEALEEPCYEVPGSDITDVIITEEVIRKKANAIFVRQPADENFVMSG